MLGPHYEGGIKGQIGPAFLDLQIISNVGLDKGSWIVTSLYIGYTLGALTNGFLYHRCTGSVLFAVSSLCLSVIIAFIPWCREYSVMVTCHTAMGLVVGLIDAAGNAEIIRLWKTKSEAILVGLHVIFNAGGVISPVIIAPFLVRNVTEEMTTSVPRLTIKTLNLTVPNSNLSLLQNSSFSTTRGDEESRIYIPYSISSVFCILHCLCFIILYITEKQTKNIGNQTKNNQGNYSGLYSLNKQETDRLNGQAITNQVTVIYAEETDKNVTHDLSKYDFQIPRSLQLLGLVVMVTIAAMSNAIDFSFSTYLSSFCVEFLHWSKSMGSVITSLLFIMVVVGGTLSMLFTKCINSIVYIGVQVTMLLTALLLFLLSALFHLTAGIWLSAPLFGFAKSAIFPLVIAWTNQTFIRVSGRISSVFFVGAMGSCSVNLFMLASIMESMGKIWFCYVLTIESIVLIIFFIIAVILSQYVKHRRRQPVTSKQTDAEL
ncbi:sodium-dependent glucose transporter 1-like isoform X2 [Ylistrum balloti]|uniref:sodium-dependent glucose transporter 1-like isoform X2 n=1 Tax=Ylistrum balloti TaxID=509963 RepID=UPI00290593D1|nr:sodium-dependent glucose transporter 1-like isoform X2 [Ylistrum balloti]